MIAVTLLPLSWFVSLYFYGTHNDDLPGLEVQRAWSHPEYSNGPVKYSGRESVGEVTFHILDSL
jgi:hypothetical protein